MVLTSPTREWLALGLREVPWEKSLELEVSI